MKLSNENIEEYILLLADNELTGTEEQEVMAFIAQHTAYKPMLDAYLSTRLDDTETFVFPDKESLLQPEPVVLAFNRTGSDALKIAAAVIVVLGMAAALAFMFSGKEDTDKGSNVLAQREKVQPVHPSVNSIKSGTTVVAHVEESETKSKPAEPKGHSLIPAIKQQPAAITADHHFAGKTTAPVYLEDATLNKLPVAMGVDPETIVMMEQQPGITAEKTLPEWLPVNEEHLQGVNDLVAHIQTLKEKIQEKTQSLKNTAFVINIGNRQISIGK